MLSCQPSTAPLPRWILKMCQGMVFLSKRKCGVVHSHARHGHSGLPDSDGSLAAAWFCQLKRYTAADPRPADDCHLRRNESTSTIY